MRVLSRLNKERGITVLLATHSVDMLPLFADRIYVLNRGGCCTVAAGRIFRDDEILDGAPAAAYISGLYELKKFGRVPIDGLPLTIGEARRSCSSDPDDVLADGAQGAP
jgi:cobalt/nickel transport system ATP-binding protein